jgi:hypothetical protein
VPGLKWVEYDGAKATDPPADKTRARGLCRRGIFARGTAWTLALEAIMTWQRRVISFERRFDYKASVHWQATESLKSRIQRFRSVPSAAGLSPDLIDEIIDWKLRGQRGRTERHRRALTERVWRDVTACAFSVKHSDADILASVQVSLLAALPGVGIGVASAILALTFPNDHGVLDFRVWKITVGTDRKSFTAQDYVKYLHALRPFAKETGWSVQKADFMVWSAYEELTTHSARPRRKRRAS